MRRVPLTVISAALIVCFGFPSVLAARAQATLTAEEIVARNIAAKGGADKLEAVNSVRITAAATVQDTITQMVIELKRPNLRRQEVTMNGQKIVQAFDGTNAWLLNPSLGDRPIQMPAPQAASLKRDAEFDSPLLNFQEKGVKVSLAGQEDVEGRPAYHLKVVTPDAATRDYYLDVNSYLEFRVDAPIEQNGSRGTLSVSMSDYRDVDGVKMPFALKQALNGRVVADLRVSTVELNVPLDVSEFRLGNGK